MSCEGLARAHLNWLAHKGVKDGFDFGVALEGDATVLECVLLGSSIQNLHHISLHDILNGTCGHISDDLT